MKKTYIGALAGAAVAAAALRWTVLPAMSVEGPPGHTHDVRAYGEPGNPKLPAHVVNVTMSEKNDGSMVFVPDRIEIKRNEQIRFVLKNAGKTDHEFVLATLADNLRHAAEMLKNPDMEHDDPNAKRLTAGKSGEIVWKFSVAGTFDFSCLIPGHREHGMYGVIVVK